MKRSTALSALVAAAALLVAGCGSNGTAGSAAPAAVSQASTGSDSGSTTGDSATDSSAPAAATDSSGGGSTADSSADGSATDSSAGSATDSSVDSSASDSSASDSSATGGSATESSATGGSGTGRSGGPSSGSTAGPSVTRTLDAGGSLDQVTTHWFDTFCTASAPLADVATAMKGGASSDPAKMMKTLGDIYTKMGGAFTDGAAKLKNAPPPTFDGGADFAKKTVEAYTELGPKLKDAGQKLSAADPKDPKAMKVIQDLGTTMQSGLGPLQDLQKMKLSPATTAAIQKIPSCKKIMSIG